MLYTLHLPLLSCPPASPGSWPLCSDWWAMEMGAVFYPAHFPFPRQPLSYLHVCIAHGVCVTTCLASWRYPMTSGDPRLGLSQPARHLSCQPKSFFFSESGCRDWVCGWGCDVGGVSEGPWSAAQFKGQRVMVASFKDICWYWSLRKGR